MDVRKGAWSSHEDSLLINYITLHGEGRWNYLATNSGLKRSGKSCRLRWKNYLCPNVRLGNFTPQEQLAILKLHSCYGNRWSKIAQCLPGRTDNEIKNFWRTRVQKQAKQLKCDLNSREFSDFIHHTWIPTLMSQQEVNVNYNGPGPLQTGFFTLSPGPHNVNYNGGECAPRPFTPDDQLLLLDYYNNNNNNNNNIGAYEIHSPARLTTPEELSHMLLTIDHDHYFCFSPSNSNSPHQLI